MSPTVKPSREQDPFAPIELILRLLIGLTLMMVVLSIVIFGLHRAGTATSVGTDWWGLGDDTSCATVAPNSSGVTNEPSYHGPTYFNTRTFDGIRVKVLDHSQQVTPHSFEFCIRHATLPVQLAAALTNGLFDEVIFLGTALLTLGAIRHARRTSLFEERTARWVRGLGWFLLIMSLVGPEVTAVGNGVVSASAVSGVSWSLQLLMPDLNWTLLIAALGVLTFARILRRAVPLQEEAALTV